MHVHLTEKDPDLPAAEMPPVFHIIRNFPERSEKKFVLPDDILFLQMKICDSCERSVQIWEYRSLSDSANVKVGCWSAAEKFGNLSSGTRVICSFLKPACGDLLARVSVDSVVYDAA